MWNPFNRSRSRDKLEPDGATKDPYQDALNDAEELIKYLAEVGKPVDAVVIENILAARDAVTAGIDNETIRANFYAAFTQLSAICGDVTARTIRYCSAPETVAALRRNRIMAITLTLLIAAVSVITFVTDDMSKKILAEIASGNADAAALRGGLRDAKGNTVKIDKHYATDEPCKLTTTPSGPDDPIIRDVDDVTLLQQFAATIRELLGRSLKLNKVIPQTECRSIRRL